MAIKGGYGAAKKALDARGIALTHHPMGAGLISVMHPQGLSAEFKGDHLVCTSGPAREGVLILYPLPQASDLPGLTLLQAFLNEFLAPATTSLNLQNLGELPGGLDLFGAAFALKMDGQDYQGVALAHQDRGLFWVACHFERSPAFEKGKSVQILKVALGTAEVAPGSALCPPLPVGVMALGPEPFLKTPNLSEALSTHTLENGLHVKAPTGWLKPPSPNADDAHCRLEPALGFGAIDDGFCALELLPTGEASPTPNPGEAWEAAFDLGGYRQEWPTQALNWGHVDLKISAWVRGPEGDAQHYIPPKRMLLIEGLRGALAFRAQMRAEADQLVDLWPGLATILATLEGPSTPTQAEIKPDPDPNAAQGMNAMRKSQAGDHPGEQP